MGTTKRLPKRECEITYKYTMYPGTGTTCVTCTCMYNHTCAAARDMKRMVFLIYSTSFGLSFALNSQPSIPHSPEHCH